MKIIKHLKSLLPDNFYLTWPSYKKVGCPRSSWEGMRDNTNARLTVDEFVLRESELMGNSCDYSNLVALLRREFRVSIFDTDDPSELKVRAVHQVLYAINKCEEMPANEEIYNGIVEVEGLIAKYKNMPYDSITLAKLASISAMPKSERIMLASMPTLTQSVRFMKSRSGNFSIESIR